jgi:hypothetical protein
MPRRSLTPIPRSRVSPVVTVLVTVFLARADFRWLAVANLRRLPPAQKSCYWRDLTRCDLLTRATGLEPATSGVRGQRSVALPTTHVADANGIRDGLVTRGAPATVVGAAALARTRASAHWQSALIHLLFPCFSPARRRCFVESQKSGSSRTFVSGASRDRTGDLLRAKQALSQLSYGPVQSESNGVPGVGRRCRSQARPSPTT